MTLYQCKRLKEMGFPDLENQRYVYIDNEYYCNPTAEEALEWVAGKLNQIINVRILIKHVMIGCHVKDGMYFEFIAECSLSDAVYALIIWAHENKLLEA